MKKSLLIAVIGVLFIGTLWGEARKYIIHVSHVGDRAVAITCTNGGDPTGTKAGDVLIISCGK